MSVPVFLLLRCCWQQAALYALTSRSVQQRFDSFKPMDFGHFNNLVKHYISRQSIKAIHNLPELIDTLAFLLDSTDLHSLDMGQTYMHHADAD